MGNLDAYNSSTGRLVPVWTLEIQTLPEDCDKILDAVMEVHPLSFGRYQRNASISAVGRETSQPQAGSTTTTHVNGFQAGNTTSFPMVELKISIERDLIALEKVLSAAIFTHHYEEPVIFVREEWASRTEYDPCSKNPNRWWNSERGLALTAKRFKAVSDFTVGTDRFQASSIGVWSGMCLNKPKPHTGLSNHPRMQMKPCVVF